MSYLDNQAWPNVARPEPWEQQIPSRSGASSAVQRDDTTAFSSQVDEVDRAIDNLVKSGKMFAMPGRRDSMPILGATPRPFPDFDPRMAGPGMQRHHSVSEYDQMRSHSAANLQTYYANQRFQSRPSEAEQMMQSKRRMAAQRERELRNYHQEQQYNRSVLAEMSAQGKAERAMSPSATNEEERRELIARQHRALYGKDGAQYGENGFASANNLSGAATPAAGPGSAAGAMRGPSPLAYDPFGMSKNQVQGQGQTQAQAQGGIVENGGQPAPSERQVNQPSVAGSSTQQSQPQSKPRSRANSTSSPASNPANFSLFDTAAQQSSRTSTSSPGGSPPRQSSKAPMASGVAPIGTRPNPAAPSQGANGGNGKRSTTPLPSPLSYGFGPKEDQNANERSASSASNPAAGAQDPNISLGWGTKSGVWGTKSSLGVQASVWG